MCAPLVHHMYKLHSLFCDDVMGSKVNSCNDVMGSKVNIVMMSWSQRLTVVTMSWGQRLTVVMMEIICKKAHSPS